MTEQTKEQTPFTVFFDDGGYQDTASDQDYFAGVDLQELIELCAARWPRNALIAWAPEYGGCHALCAESIAAGRVIKQNALTGKYVPFGVETAKQRTPTVTEQFYVTAETLTLSASIGKAFENLGVFHAAQAKPKRYHGFTCPECGSHYFGSSTWKGDFTGYCHGNQHTGNGCKFTWNRRNPDEEAACMYEQSPEEWAADYIKPEPKRPRLTWADSKPFDAFPGYATDKWSIENDLYTDSSHPTQRIASASAQPDPGHALAAVRQLVR